MVGKAAGGVQGRPIPLIAVGILTSLAAMWTALIRIGWPWAGGGATVSRC